MPPVCVGVKSMTVGEWTCGVVSSSMNHHPPSHHPCNVASTRRGNCVVVQRRRRSLLNHLMVLHFPALGGMFISPEVVEVGGAIEPSKDKEALWLGGSSDCGVVLPRRWSRHAFLLRFSWSKVSTPLFCGEREPKEGVGGTRLGIAPSKYEHGVVQHGGRVAPSGWWRR